MKSCIELKEALTEIGLEHDWLLGWNESLVTRARNEMTASFLATDYRYMMWLDADIEFAPEDVAALWNLQVDVAVGVCPMKKPDQCWYAAWKDGALVKDLDRLDGPIEVDYAGTGFMLIGRACIEKMAAVSESYEGPNGRVPCLYNTPVHNDGFESEDYHFCRRWREQGGKIVMDPSVRLTHWGAYPYAG